MRIYGLTLIFLLISSGLAFSQPEGFVTGTVVDSVSREPLAFVSILYNQAGHGVVTNLDGVFQIPRSNKIQFLKFRYIGYNSKTIAFPGGFRNGQRIALSPDPLDIKEVVVYPTVNPAHRIVQLASENRNRNNPEKSGPFSYISYDKMVFGVEPDSAMNDKPADSSELALQLPDSIPFGMDREGKIDVQRFLDKQYLFMMESVSSRKYISPEKNKEEIIASRVSGLSQPSFVVMARQFQSFSFYENFVTIADRQLLNPISSGSTDKYFFLIQDTLFTETNDTVFIISFRPYKGRNFDGMKGVIYINSNGYAVQNVIAEAYEQKDERVSVSIQQQYELVNGQRWFPVLLSSTIRFNPSKMGVKAPPGYITGTGKSYIVNINFNPTIDEEKFSNVQIEVSPDAHRQPEQVWRTYRTDSLNAREVETYRVIDSLGKAEHLDRTMISFETILTGYLPGRYWSFDIRRFIDYNPYEGFRFGAGGKTTERVSRFFTIGGYAAYGLKDKEWKYSGSLTLNLWPDKELETAITYRNDVRESGGVQFNEEWNITGSAFVRDYMVEVMDLTRETGVSAGFRTLKYLSVKGFLIHSELSPTNGYAYSLSEGNPQVSLTSFNITETGLRLKYAYKETFMKSPRGNKFSMGTSFPVLYLNVARGLNWLNGGYTYWRTEAKITKNFRTKSFGETRVAVISGMVNGSVPYSRLYAGMGSYRSFTLETEQSFGTMRFNEFLSDRFVSLHVKQNFGKLLFKPRGKFQPEMALVHNLGFGLLKEKDPHENIEFNTLEKGYFEGGLLINNLLKVQLFRYGLGVFYRYGPYAYAKTIDNFAFKLTLQFNL
ncbi:MAG: carboxypeptidase-like regulatory domain-containing protein [Bacteroidales bacterium]|nr:carboxypeptidase-like regulatory domain-containing protein [Bacteroidales bacterium]